MTGSSREPAATVDALGLLCPLPVLRVEQAARRLAPGAVLAVLADDPAITDDLPAWCAGRGHALLSLQREETIDGQPRWRGLIELAGPAA